MTFHPYLFFGGDCAAAFTRYQEIFGGELEIMRLRDAPVGEGGMPGADPDTVLHAAITFDDGRLLMGSDDPVDPDFGAVHGMMVAYSAADPGEARRVFDTLAEGDSVTQALTETFFSPAFGMCTDRFGTPWMVSCEAPGTG
jgi:PhnB protein